MLESKGEVTTVYLEEACFIWRDHACCATLWALQKPYNLEREEYNKNRGKSTVLAGGKEPGYQAKREQRFISSTCRNNLSKARHPQKALIFPLARSQPPDVRNIIPKPPSSFVESAR